MNRNIVLDIIYKISIINSSVDRAIKLSNEKFHNKYLFMVKETLLRNGFPSNIAKTKWLEHGWQ